MTVRRCELAGLALAAGCVALTAPARAEMSAPTVGFAAHRAIYELSIDTSSTSPGSGVSSIGGRIVYELTGSACDGFTQNMRFVTVTSNSDGGNQTTDLRTSSWEQVPATKLRFSSSTYQNDEIAEQARGTALRATPQDAPSVDLAKPEKKSFAISAPVYFPMQHSAALIQSARDGKTHFLADLYDGSENGSKIYTTSALIGHRLAPGTGAIKALAGQKAGSALDAVPSWPVSISYFAQVTDAQVKHKDEVPLYEMSYRFHENGVTSDLRLDYGEYALKGELKELVFLEPSTCPADKP
ncbi:MAG: cell envelope integrity EipB family protein [Hyphomicrobium sp.]